MVGISQDGYFPQKLSLFSTSVADYEHFLRLVNCFNRASTI